MAAKKKQPASSPFGPSSNVHEVLAAEQRAQQDRERELRVPETIEADGRKWTRVKAAKKWNPKRRGETLVGQLLDRQMKDGSHGRYAVTLVRDEQGETWSLSGVVINALFDAALIAPGHPVRVVFEGWKNGAADHAYRDFELYVGERQVFSEQRS